MRLFLTRWSPGLGRNQVSLLGQPDLSFTGSCFLLRVLRSCGDKNTTEGGFVVAGGYSRYLAGIVKNFTSTSAPRLTPCLHYPTNCMPSLRSTLGLPLDRIHVTPSATLMWLIGYVRPRYTEQDNERCRQFREAPTVPCCPQLWLAPHYGCTTAFNRLWEWHDMRRDLSPTKNERLSQRGEY